MKEIKLGEKTYEVELSLYTLVVYEDEFDGANMLADFYGVERLKKPDKDSDVLFELDYSDFNWTNGIRAFWAGVKTADKSTPPFAKWVKTVDGDVNMLDVMRGEFFDYMNERFFRPDEPAGEAGGAEDD